MTIDQLKRKCRLCGCGNIEKLIDFGERPITKRLLTSLMPESEEYTYPVVLFVCKDCGFVQILDVVPQEELYTNYELFTSWKPQLHLQDEIEVLLKNGYVTTGSFVVEIGCNDGIALKLLKLNGVPNLLGIEPSRDVAIKASEQGFDVINDYFTKEKAGIIESQYGKADLIICRQVLEHVSYIDSFMQGVQGLIKIGGNVMFEVPDFSVPIKYGDISAIWEEHVNYFTEDSLGQLLSFYGFKSLLVKKYNFSGGAVCVIARYISQTDRSFMTVDKTKLDSILSYPERIDLFLKKVCNFLETEKRNGKKIALYGAGNRAVILLNHALKDYVDIVVDDQPEKQNKFVPVCHLPILPSEELIKQNIGLCLLAVNAENEDAVILRNKAFTQSGGRFASILSPSIYIIN